MKADIVNELGQTGILLPSLVADGLAANDRVKARLSILQAAAAHARNPDGVRFNLAGECNGAGLDPIPMEMLVNRANASGELIAAPGLRELGNGIWSDVTTMVRAVQAADAADGDALLQRLAKIRADSWPEPADSIAFAQVSKLAALSGHDSDSLHRFVMDLHKALLRLSAANADEVLMGAHVFGLQAEDRPFVEAFIRGVDATRKLKFDHPGLASTAARSGSRLIIQNDIGETDAHVLVVAIEQDTVTVTYTDVHGPRAKFFTRLLRDFPVEWSGLDRKDAKGLGDDGGFYLITGRHTGDAAANRDFLQALGSMLVFLIDWNKARKVLRNWIPKDSAVQLLDWAARHRIGHRAFLELGGGDLVASAVRHAASTRIGFGEQLDHALGRSAALDFLKSVLRISAEALLEGRSVRLARDRIETDLVQRLERVDSELLARVVRQAGLAREIAGSVARFVAEQQGQRPFDRNALAVQARRIEEKADRIAFDVRAEVERLGADSILQQLVDSVEDTIDDLEQAAFIASLAPNDIHPELLAPLAELCAAAVSGTEAVATGVAAASDLPDGHRVDADDAIASVARLIEAEHNADAAERKLTAAVLQGKFDLGTSLTVLELARSLETSTDRMAGAGHLLREYVLANLST